jgi:hypothetical protein
MGKEKLVRVGIEKWVELNDGERHLTGFSLKVSCDEFSTISVGFFLHSKLGVWPACIHL